MKLNVTSTSARTILTRTGGYLSGVTSHSLQPYSGCALGSSLCGVGCYVQHNRWLTRGRRWGSYVEAKTNAAELYLKQYDRERRWARRTGGRFSIFCSSSTEPFQPIEFRLGLMRSLLTAMLEAPPDELVLQTHSHRVVEYLPIIEDLSRRCDLRVHVSIETDRETLPGLPKPASPVPRRIESLGTIRQAGIRAVATVAPLLPMADPGQFFAILANAVDAVVIDHFIGGDGSSDGARTRRTQLPLAMEATEPGSTTLEYRDQMIAIARQHLPGRVGVGAPGFAGAYA